MPNEQLPTVNKGTGDLHEPKCYDHAIIGNYLKKKHMAFSQFAGFPQPAYWFFSKANFTKIFTTLAARVNAGGFRVYLGFCGSAGFPSQLQGCAGSMLLIFTATDEQYNDLYCVDNSTPYFTVTPPSFGGGNFMDGKLVQLSHDEVRPMVAAYQQNIAPLSDALNAAVLAWYSLPPNPTFKETNSLWYSLKWQAAVYSDIIQYDVEGLSFYLGSYADDACNDKAVLQQLTLVLEYAKFFDYSGVTYYFHFDIENMCGGKPQPPHAVSAAGTNTANPCPPNTCGSLSEP